MIRKVSMLGLAIVLAVIGLGLFASLIAVADSVGTAFTYQGYLEDGGSAADGTYEFKFRLYDAASDGSQVGSEVVKDDETVSDGLFTVELDFGSDAFTGDARWLEIDVKADAEGSYTTISPRTALTPAPYALHAVDAWSITGNSGTTHGTHFLGTTDNVSLTLAVSNTAALRLEPATFSGFFAPNVIGGFSDNSVTAGKIGATIGGGGYSSNPNSVTDFFGTVGGGADNTASGVAATVGGGESNEASGQQATVGGGSNNIASSDQATVGGGYTNEASDSSATVGGGDSNTASGEYATVPGGYQAQASLYGQMAYASGQFAAVGDAQASLYALRNATSDATETELYLDGSSRRLTVASGRTMTFDILVVARSDGGASAGYRVEGVIENVGGITSFIGIPTVTELGEDDDWTVAVEDDDTYDALVIKVTGADSTNIRWVATVRTAEVAY
jgi:hypothetical protein